MFKRTMMILAAVLLTAACQPKSQNGPNDDTAQQQAAPAGNDNAGAAADQKAATPKSADSTAAAGDAAGATDGSVESTAILARERVTDKARVKHVLISWKAQSELYAKRGGQDPRGAERTKADADKLAKSILDKANSGVDFDKLMSKYSEDPGSAKSGRSYKVTPTASLVAPFKKLSLRLNPKEAGIVRSAFGYHIIYRVK